MGKLCDFCGAFIPYPDLEFCKEGPFLVCNRCATKIEKREEEEKKNDENM